LTETTVDDATLGGADPTGYLHPSYARSLSEFGRPRHLRSCDGWILEREIPGSSNRDAIGCYPLFVCRDWSALCADIEATAAGLVSVALVTDPFGGLAETELRSCFDHVLEFKDHLIVDLSQSDQRRTSRHHRRYARAARKNVVVEKCDDPSRLLDDWMRLYGVLVARHGLTGLRAFSQSSFELQLSLPGAVMFRAVADGATVGAQIWYVQGAYAYNHLVATDAKGYELRAAFALYSEALECLAATCSLADLGAGPGAGSKAANGLAEFKRGWATATRPAYFCGRIYDRAVYDRLTRARAPAGTSHFPGYRVGEFG
jgi:hypothetical protein